MRRLGAFLPGEGVGGSGVHWNGMTWRWLPNKDQRARSFYQERFGKAFIPPDMPLQDWGVTYDELAPYYDKFEYAFAISGKAGNINGQIQPGGNPFEPPRQREFPLPPLKDSLATELFGQAARSLGYHPFIIPACQRVAGLHKPRWRQIWRVPVLRPLRPFRLRSECQGQSSYCCDTYRACATRMSNSGRNHGLRKSIWIRQANAPQASHILTSHTGAEYEQPAGIVILCAYGLGNIHLMLLSGIGKPYDPVAGKGVVGKNYAYQVYGYMTLFFEDKIFNPFMGAGALSCGLTTSMRMRNLTTQRRDSLAAALSPHHPPGGVQ